ncbi:MAG TPA: DUF6600 domain-containing protein [Terracidiphilus sp.]|nr:DUF6600 domain-containing protein [Terracidiphilus sp.]
MQDPASPRVNRWLTAIAFFAGIALACAPVQAQDDPPAQAGRLSYISGSVSVQPADTNDWGEAFPNLPISPGDRIFTYDDGRAEVQIGRTWLRIGPNSDITLIDASPGGITYGVGQGAVHVHILGLWDQQSFIVQTPSGSTTVNDAADFRVDVMPENQAAIVTDNSGPVYISGAGDFGVETAGGQALELIGSNPVTPQWLEPAYPDQLDHFSQGRDQQIARSMSYRYLSPEIPGGDEMDANGDWMPASDYGAVWFPRVSADWAPYRQGHWIHRGTWGWVWVEDESWGYAPFHYGRWVNIRGRWGWVPGPPAEHPVWSPALVVFAGGGSPGVSVWFPLGPGEPYRPWYHCSPRYVDRVNISNITPSRVVHVQTTYVNVVNVNVTNITYVNRTSGYTAVRQEDFAAGRPVARASVHLDANVVQHAQVIAAAPAVQPTHAAIMGSAPPRAVPVRVAAARPTLINPQGKMVAAQPHAQAVEAPVKPAPVARPLPGRTAIAQPPTAKIAPPSQHVMARGAPMQPTAHPMPVTTPQPKGAPMQPAAHPIPVTTPQPKAPPAEQPKPVPPAMKPNPEPVTRPAPPAMKPNPEPAPRPAPPVVKPVPEPAPRPAPPVMKPNPEPAAPRPAPPAMKPNPEPAPRPAPPVMKPNPEPAARPAPPAAKPEAKPAPPPKKPVKPEDKKPQ